MIGFVKGTIADFEEDMVILEVQGVGMNIRATTQTLTNIGNLGDEVKLYTYLYVKEDALVLYGFPSKEDMRIFKLLITVNGIGPKGALSILNAISPDELRFAILAGDSKAIAKAPGIGAKTASRVILDLKDKLSLEEAFEAKLSHNSGALASGIDNNAKAEAIEALTALGYSPSESLKAVNSVEIDGNMDTEVILKAALKHISF
ncbi:MAG: Holliday junction branch migration protein RuvA [Lachnospiraceae bacterium]|nr:Holliday junction branch migration protein RuvA [Lachnospiraceae bacterium]